MVWLWIMHVSVYSAHCTALKCFDETGLQFKFGILMIRYEISENIVWMR